MDYYYYFFWIFLHLHRDLYKKIHNATWCSIIYQFKTQLIFLDDMCTLQGMNGFGLLCLVWIKKITRIFSISCQFLGFWWSRVNEFFLPWLATIIKISIFVFVIFQSQMKISLTVLCGSYFSTINFLFLF